MLTSVDEKADTGSPIPSATPVPGEVRKRRGKRSIRAPRLGLLLACALAVHGAPSAGSVTKRVAVLPVEFLKADYFPDAGFVSPEEQARLDMVAAMIRERLSREGFGVAARGDTEAAISAADPGTRLHECNGCERDIGRALDSDWVLVGWIQMVSNLIVNLNVLVYDVDSGARVAQAFVDLRGNTQRSWRRATTYLLDRILVARMIDAARRAP